MGHRNGCSSGVFLVAGCGIKVEGTGEDDDPYIISIDPCAIAGTGLKVEGDCKLAVSDGAPPDGDTSKPASVTKLSERARCQNIVGGMLGGYYYKPQSTRASVKYATDRGYDFIHLPVRFLSDRTPVITPDVMLGRQNGNVADQQVQNQNIARWQSLPNDAGAPPEPTAGWFGYNEPTEQGLLTLNEALDMIGNKITTVLELMWPITPDQGGAPVWTPGQEPPPERVESFIRNVKTAIEQRGAQENVIVTSQFPKVPGREPGSTRDVFAELGLPHTGPSLYDPADADRNPPASGDSGGNPGQEQGQEPAPAGQP